MYIAGIDEAGRGPVIGPMVMAILACKEDEEQALKKMGVRDSKDIPAGKREQLALSLEEYDHEIIALAPDEIDAAVQGDEDNLNLLEARTSALLIHRLAERVPIEKVIIDSPTKNGGKYEAIVRKELERLTDKEIELLCETKADANYPVVGAASILAKVTRDAAIRGIEEEHGPLGSGYPSDPRTQEFLHETWQDGHDFFRKSWESFKRLARMADQSSLEDFYEEKRKRHGEEIEAFEQLKEHGFRFLEPTNPYEVVRMRKDRVTIIKYTTGKVVVQGPSDKKEEAERLLELLDLD